jgi:O-antigen/teichoic acid export membrane protein
LQVIENKKETFSRTVVTGFFAGTGSRPPASGSRLRYARDRAASLTGAASIVNRLAALAVRLVTVPLALHALGAERYGLWMAVASLLSWLTLFDFGIGSGLINPLSRAHAEGDHRTVARLVSSALVVCAISAAAILGVVEFTIHRLDLAALLGAGYNSGLRAEAFRVTRAAGWLTAGTFFFSFVGPFCFSAQRGYLSSLVGIVGVAVSAVAVAAAAASHSSTVIFIAATSVPPLAATALLAAFLFLGPFSNARPAPTLFSRGALREVAGCGWPLLLTQIAGLTAMQSGNVMIAHRFGPAAVPRYSVPFAMFSAGSGLCYSLIAPYWPAYTEALARGDWTWLAATLRKTLRRTLGFMAPACVAAVLFGRSVIRLWAGKDAVPPFLLIACMSAYFLLCVWSMNYGMLLLGLGALRSRAALALIVAASHIAGFYLLSPWMGLASIPLGGSAGLMIELLAGRAICRRSLKRSIS